MPETAAGAPDHPAPASLAPGTVIGGRFLIRRKLGGGGMGEVYLAENVAISDKKYAIKVLLPQYSRDPWFSDLLRAEASKQARLEHDHVVGMYDFFEWSGHCCLVQNFIDGRTLASILEAQPGGLALEETLRLMTGILGGLDYAHAHGILHCDVKPGNVMVDQDGRPRVTDFGISRDVSAKPGSASDALGSSGTTPYMSPEQLTPPFQFDHRADVFAAGVVMYELLAGRQPFAVGKDGPAQLFRDAPDVRELRCDVPEQIAGILALALARDREQRFQSCSDFAHAIDSYLKARQWRRRWIPIGAGVALVLGVAALGLNWWHAVEKARLEREQHELAERNRETVRNGLHNAAQSLNELCHESQEYLLKLPGKQHVHDMIASAPDGEDREKFIQLEKDFDAKLASIRASLDQRRLDYRDALGTLRPIAADLVAVELRGQEQNDHRLREFGPGILADLVTVRSGAPTPEASALAQRCVQPAGLPGAPPGAPAAPSS